MNLRIQLEVMMLLLSQVINRILLTVPGRYGRYPRTHARLRYTRDYMGPVSLRLKMSWLYDIVTHQILAPGKMHILRCMGSKSCEKFHRAHLEFDAKFWTHIFQNMHFTEFYISKLNRFLILTRGANSNITMILFAMQSLVAIFVYLIIKLLNWNGKMYQKSIQNIVGDWWIRKWECLWKNSFILR